jgi:hypothetical protein
VVRVIRISFLKEINVHRKHQDLRNFCTLLKYTICARSSGAVHSVLLINVYLDLENPGGSGFWVGENRRVTEGTEWVSLQAPGSRGGRILTQKEGSK